MEEMPLALYTWNLNIWNLYSILKGEFKSPIVRGNLSPLWDTRTLHEEDEAITQAYNHEWLLTHSTSSGYFVSVNEV